MGRKLRDPMSLAQHKKLRKKERAYDKNREGSTARHASRTRYAKKRSERLQVERVVKRLVRKSADLYTIAKSAAPRDAKRARTTQTAVQRKVSTTTLAPPLPRELGRAADEQRSVRELGAVNHAAVHSPEQVSHAEYASQPGVESIRREESSRRFLAIRRLKCTEPPYAPTTPIPALNLNENGTIRDLRGATCKCPRMIPRNFRRRYNLGVVKVHWYCVQCNEEWLW